MKAKKTRKHHIRRIAKIHGLVTAGFVLAYLLAGFLLGKNVFVADLQNKYFAGFAISATVRVWGPPSAPDITLAPVCSGGNSYILVDWDADENATSFDVFRNGEELITGLATSSYQDHNVQDQTGYSYYVIARGPEGEEASLEESVETSDCSIPLADPEIRVTRFEDLDLTSYSQTPTTNDQRPEFYGTSNIANGTVRVEAYSSPAIVATTTTNSNGYWSWTPASNLSFGLITAYFTVIDPLDASRTDTTVLTFRIEEEEEEDDEEDDDEEEEESSSETGSGEQAEDGISQTGQTGEADQEHDQERETESPGLFEQAPIDLSLRISEIDAVRVQGTDLGTQVYPGYAMSFEVTVASFKGADSGRKPIFVYSILDSNGEEVYRVAEERDVAQGQVFSKKIVLPSDLEPGKYKLRIEAIVGEFSVSEERYFQVEESPIISFKSNVIDLATGLFSDLGWIVIIAILILLILIILAIVEWRIHQSREALSCPWPRNNSAK